MCSELEAVEAEYATTLSLITLNLTLPGQVLGLLPCLPSSLDTCILNQKYFTTVKLFFNNSQFKELNFFALLW